MKLGRRQRRLRRRVLNILHLDERRFGFAFRTKDIRRAFDPRYHNRGALVEENVDFEWGDDGAAFEDFNTWDNDEEA